MFKTLIKCLCIGMLMLLAGCSNYIVNDGVVRVESSPLGQFKPGTLNLVDFRTTPRWDLLDDDDKAWVLVTLDGKLSFYPLSEVSTAPGLLQSLGTVSNFIPAPTIPIPF